MKPKVPVNPKRETIAWQKEDFYDEEKLMAEVRRVFEICHGCRRCFNLCGVFPKLFDRIDAYEGEVERLTKEDVDQIVGSCTLCDMCFTAKCPYVPPHPWNVDFPRLMLRYRAVRGRKTYQQRASYQLAKMDRNGAIGTTCASIVNGSCACTRPLIEKVAGIDRRAPLPLFRKGQLKSIPEELAPPPNPQGKAYGKKVGLYLTCFTNYYEARIAEATAAVLAYQGFFVTPFYPGCCGMPLYEQGAVAEVAKNARNTSKQLQESMQAQGIQTLISLVPSCTLMLKSEWPDLCPEDSSVMYVADHTFDVCDFMMSLVQEGLWMEGLKSLPGGVALHLACHVRAQNRGKRSYQLLSLLPDTPILVIERCSGHGGLFGFQKQHFEEAMRVGKPVFSAVKKADFSIVSSECPLALAHIAEGCKDASYTYQHPIEIIASSYGVLS